MHTDLMCSAANFPERTVIEHEGRQCTYSELLERSQRVAQALRCHNLSHGDCVGVMLPNCLEWAYAFYGASINSNTIVPLSTMLTVRELGFVLAQVELKLIFVGLQELAVVRRALAQLVSPPLIVVVGGSEPASESFDRMLTGPSLAPATSQSPERHALTMFTSGTTGAPKGAMLSVGNLRAQVDMACQVFEPREGERVLSALPLFHAFGLNGVLQVVVRYGGTLVLHSRFDVRRCLQTLADDQITWFAAVPTMYAYLLANAPAVVAKSSLRYCVSGGAPLSVALAQEFQQRFGVPIFNAYGLTETVVAACCNRPLSGGSKEGSVGRPFDGMKVRIVGNDGDPVPVGERGEIAVSGPTVMLGYYREPAATAEVLRDGWFFTGDVGYLDDDGFCFVVDRMKDVIIKGGFNVYPREVEDVLCELPEVAEAAVVGTPDPFKGEIVCAVLVIKPGCEFSERRVVAHLRERLAKNKHPNSYRCADSLPKGATGKVLKEQVRRSLAQSPQLHTSP